ncbi:MAG: efflux RND transporter periplasmic adaptor subunit [Magnetococcales bacterium]|nr:efflux RND transporter periplasmic adaptor subunit [Magnetococcales bacterium]
MNAFVKTLLAVMVLGGSAAIGLNLLTTAPRPEKKKIPPMVPVVEVIQAQPTHYRIQVPSQGSVTPRTRITLAAQVAGVVMEIDPSLRNGGFFDQGQTLARIDGVDYEHAVTIAAAEVAKARLSLSEARAQADQARRDWKKSGLDGTPGDLAVHRPQLEQAQALLAAARARLNQARVDRERTRIQAPFAGRVLEKMVDVGQFVSRGTVIASIYAVDSVEVRLPITDTHAAFLRLPESYPGETTPEGPPVTLKGVVGGRMQQWQGRIVRTEGTLDTRTRQLWVIAQIDAPYARAAEGRAPLKVGQHVEATIKGSILKNVFVIPRHALLEDQHLRIVTETMELMTRAVQVAWMDREQAVLTAGLRTGESICLTPLPYAIDGMKVRIHRPETPVTATRRGRP